MSKVSRLGIDLAKDVFQLYGVDSREHVVCRRRLRRRSLRRYMAQLPPCQVAMEACGSAHFWAREFQKMGHEVDLIAAWRVARYRDSAHKTDARDAIAICEAAGRPRMPCVPIKAPWQQELQAMHRMREQLVKQRNAVANQLRGLLLEFGMTVPKGIDTLRRRVPEVLEDAENGFGDPFRQLLAEQYDLLRELETRLARCQRQLEREAKHREPCRRLSAVEGVGPLAATAFVAAVGDGHAFDNAPQVGAWLGLVPKEFSSGNARRLGVITKRGDRYLRTLLIQGARAAVRTASRKSDRRHRWMERLRREKGFNKAAVALANKNARTMWALLVRDEAYQPATA